MPVVESLRVGDMSKGEPVPEGIYHLRCAKTEWKTADPTQKNPDPYPYINIQWTVTGSSPEEFHGRALFDILTLDPKGNFRLRRLAEALWGEDEDLDIVQAFREGKFTDAEVQASVKVTPAGKGADGKFYDARNQIVKYMSLVNA